MKLTYITPTTSVVTLRYGHSLLTTSSTITFTEDGYGEVDLQTDTPDEGPALSPLFGLDD